MKCCINFIFKDTIQQKNKNGGYLIKVLYKYKKCIYYSSLVYSFFYLHSTLGFGVKYYNPKEFR